MQCAVSSYTALWLIWHLAALSAVCHIVSSLPAPYSWSTGTSYIRSLVLTFFFHLHIPVKKVVDMNITSLVTETHNAVREYQSPCEGNLCSNWSCRWLALLVHQELETSHISVIAYKVKFKPTFHYCTSCFQCNTDCSWNANCHHPEL